MVHHSFGHLNYDEACKFSSIQSSDKSIEDSQFIMVIFKREVSVQIGEVLTCTKCSCEAIISSSTVQSLH